MQARKRRGGRPGAQRGKPWFVQYREPDGTQKSPGFATKRAADDWIAQHGAQIRARTQLVPLVPSDSTVADYGARWLADIKRSVKPRTHESYGKQLELYLRPRLGTRPVADLSRPELRAFLIDCREEGVRGAPLKMGSVYAIYATLRALLNAAIEDGLRGDNPAARLGKKLHLHPTKIARQAALRARALDREQTAQLLEATRTRAAAWYPLVLTLARTGLRLGEALMLQLGDYNAAAGTLRVERAWDAKHHCAGSPKHGPRVIDVSPALAAILDAHAAALGKVVGLDGAPVVPWLFPSQAGTMLEGRNVRRALARLAQRARLGRSLTPHDLRHTFGSQLIAAGLSPVYVQRQMGHASVQITVDLYGSGLPLEARGGVAVLDELGTGADPGGGTVVVRGGTGPRRRGGT
jgi:integrase